MKVRIKETSHPYYSFMPETVGVTFNASVSLMGDSELIVILEQEFRDKGICTNPYGHIAPPEHEWYFLEREIEVINE